MFAAAGGEKTGLLSYVAFSDFWRKMCATHHDETAQFMHILTCRGGGSDLGHQTNGGGSGMTPGSGSGSGRRRTFLLPEDFIPLVQDVVDAHPGLGFLKEATEFHSRYVHTVSSLDPYLLFFFKTPK